MQIDWTTFALEVVNFLALVWILKRFLYRPVLDVLARRRAGVERTLAEGRDSMAQAAALQQQFEQRLADWGKEKAALRAALDAELAGEREAQMLALQRSLADERTRQAAQKSHRQTDLRHTLETQAVDQAGRFAAALLTRLADPALEARLLDLLLEDLGYLADEQTTAIRASAAATTATVVSTWPLDADQRERLAQALARVLGHVITLTFTEDTTLVAGLRLTIGPWQLKANLADELAFFAASATYAD
jgi:F-type H+-transporting ATPase subunit b